MEAQHFVGDISWDLSEALFTPKAYKACRDDILVVGPPVATVGIFGWSDLPAQVVCKFRFELEREPVLRLVPHLDLLNTRASLKKRPASAGDLGWRGAPTCWSPAHN